MYIVQVRPDQALVLLELRDVASEDVLCRLMQQSKSLSLTET